MKLNKSQLRDKDILTRQLASGYHGLEVAIGVYEKSAKKDNSLVLNALVVYNEVLTEAKTWCEGIAERIEEFIDSKSESWQESDAAEAHGEWMDSYRDAELDPVTIEDIILPGDYLDLSSIEDASEVMMALEVEPNG